MNATIHPEVARYLRDLDRALRDVPGSRRREIVEEISDHIEEALAELPPDAEDFRVRAILD